MLSWLPHARLIACLICATVLVIAPHATTSAAGPIVVTSALGTTTTDGQCTLREAIANANADAALFPDCTAGSGADTIILAAGATYSLSAVDNQLNGANGLPSISGPLVIRGNGATIARSTAFETPRFRLFHVGATGKLTLRDLTIANGFAHGDDVSANTGDGAGTGGGLYNAGGQVALERVTLRDNRAEGGKSSVPGNALYRCEVGSGCGGGLYSNGGNVTVQGSTIRNNTAKGNGEYYKGGNSRNVCASGTGCGGGLYTYGGSITVTTSLLQVNQAIGGDTNFNTDFAAPGGGGGVVNGNGRLAIVDSQLVANSAIGGDGLANDSGSARGGMGLGGGVINVGLGQNLLITNTELLSNTAVGGVAPPDSRYKGGLAFGGGLYNCTTNGFDSPLLLTNVRIAGNEAYTDRNGQLVPSAGGGVFNECGWLWFKRSAVQNNTAGSSGGGITVSDLEYIVLDDSTVSGNQTLSDPAFGGQGGGISMSGILIARNSTISGNRASGKGGGLYQGEGSAWLLNVTLADNASGTGGGGLFLNTVGSAYLRNSIVASNTTGGDCAGNAVLSEGYNLDSDGSCRLDETGDKSRVDARLGPLQNNGGATLTHALLPGSPAIDNGNPQGCRNELTTLLTTDQRGVARPQGTRCDSGAYEREVAPTTPTTTATTTATAAPTTPTTTATTTTVTTTTNPPITAPARCDSTIRCAHLPLLLGIAPVAAPAPTTPTATTVTTTPSPAPSVSPTRDAQRCDPSYPEVCIPPPPPDLNCPDIPFRNFRVIGRDPHRFDTDNDGVGCEQ